MSSFIVHYHPIWKKERISTHTSIMRCSRITKRNLSPCLRKTAAWNCVRAERRAHSVERILGAIYQAPHFVPRLHMQHNTHIPLEEAAWFGGVDFFPLLLRRRSDHVVVVRPFSEGVRQTHATHPDTDADSEELYKSEQICCQLAVGLSQWSQARLELS